MSFTSPGSPGVNALLLGDHLEALGWRVPLGGAERTGSSFSLRFSGFGWSGQALFVPAQAASTAVVIEMTGATP